MFRSAIGLAVAAALFCPAASWAGDWPDSCLPADDNSAPANEGAIWSIQFLSGYYQKAHLGPPLSWLPQYSRLDYAPQALRLGCECPETFLPGMWLEGTWEALLEVNFSPIVRDYGTYFSGPCGIVRYNFRHEDSVVIPYLQGGAGFVLNDAYRVRQQDGIGEAFEFLLRCEVGLRFPLTERLSLDVEGGYQHVSNACLASRNGGINNLGISVGFTYEFGRK